MTNRTKADNTPIPDLRVEVFPAAAFWVNAGANQGDALAPAADCVAGDIYELERGTPPLRLALVQAGAPGQAPRIAAGSDIGAPGEALQLASRATFMAPDGERVEVLLVIHEASGQAFVLPMSPLAPATDYTLLGASAETDGVRLVDMVCVSLAAGTTLTLPGGSRRPIESLRPGDILLTRDHGPQPLRWVGRATLRAQGAFAPVVIAAGTLGNVGDLVVSQHHRIFLYQRGEKRIGGRAELLVQAKHLVDGSRVTLREGGYVDYYSLVFDRHEIVYAEGIPCESLLVNEATLNRLPGSMAEDVRARFPGLTQSQHFGTEAGREALDALGPGQLFRRSAEE